MGCCCSSKYDKAAVIPDKLYPAFEEKLPNLEGKVIAITGCTSGTGF